MSKERENRRHVHLYLPFLVSFLPLEFWFCWAFWLFSSVLRTADSYRSLNEDNKLQCWRYSIHSCVSFPPGMDFLGGILIINTYFLLLQSLFALLLHSSTPPLLFEPLLQELLFALLQLLFIVLPGPLLPLQPVQLPRGWRKIATSINRLISYVNVTRNRGHWIKCCVHGTATRRSHTEQLLLLFSSLPCRSQPLINVLSIHHWKKILWCHNITSNITISYVKAVTESTAESGFAWLKA